MLTFLDEKDDQFEVLFKYYETMQNFQKNMQELEGKANGYQQDQKFYEDGILKERQLKTLKEEVSFIEAKAAKLMENYSLL
mmetsp:Transcript_13063/g.12911  ORF Transcript_13063/g.12911 Transcript_13063/m.12911 type:complete len:81 (+) Transcript_13063:162-404(+)